MELGLTSLQDRALIPVAWGKSTLCSLFFVRVFFVSLFFVREQVLLELERKCFSQCLIGLTGKLSLWRLFFSLLY